MKQFFKKIKNIFKKQKSNYILLAHESKYNLGLNKKVDIILSPKYYWAKKEKLPVKYAYQAKAYAPSSFEGIIPEGHYTYLTKKQGDEFILYAYDDSFIINQLQNIGIRAEHILNVYFAQNEFSNFKIAIELNPNECLISHDGVIIKVPKSMVEDSISIDEYFKSHSLSDFCINLNKFNKIIDFKKAYIISTLLALVSIFYFSEFLWLGGLNEEQEHQKQKIIKEYRLPKTSMQTELLMKKLQKKADEQILIREKFYIINKLPLQKEQFIQEISFSSKLFKIVINIEKNANFNKIKSYLQKYFKLNSVKNEKKQVIFEVKI